MLFARQRVRRLEHEAADVVAFLEVRFLLRRLLLLKVRLDKRHLDVRKLVVQVLGIHLWGKNTFNTMQAEWKSDMTKAYEVLEGITIALEIG